MFEHFARRDVSTGAGTIHARVGGSGPPLLLLHGYPQTHAMWHRVAPTLAAEFTVVAPDLRGYGDSSKPAGAPPHLEYSKRELAADQVAVMRALGYDRFAVVGHDRGARVAHRMCLDHRDAVTRAAVLDIVPTRHMFDTADRAFGMTYYHWFFLAQPHPLPERMIGADPPAFLRWSLEHWSAPGFHFDDLALDEYLRCFADPATVHASCEDYRAAATIDLEHDAADFSAGRRVDCPLLAIWGTRGFIARQYDPLTVWREYCTGAVTGSGVDSGHFVAEEAPEQTLAALLPFLRGAPGA